MSSSHPFSLVAPVEIKDHSDTPDSYVQQYTADFVARWDELIDWEKRAAGEGSFFSTLLLRAGACRVLDASTGTGFHAVRLRRAGFEVVACDGSRTMFERARVNFARYKQDIPLLCLDWH